MVSIGFHGNRMSPFNSMGQKKKLDWASPVCDLLHCISGKLSVEQQSKVHMQCDVWKVSPILISTFFFALLPTDFARLWMPLSSPSAFVRMAAVAFTCSRAHSKAAWDHLHAWHACHVSPGGPVSHCVTSSSSFLFVLPWYLPPPQPQCASLPVSSQKGPLGRPVPQF